MLRKDPTGFRGTVLKVQSCQRRTSSSSSSVSWAARAHDCSAASFSDAAAVCSGDGSPLAGSNAGEGTTRSNPVAATFHQWHPSRPKHAMPLKRNPNFLRPSSCYSTHTCKVSDPTIVTFRLLNILSLTISNAYVIGVNMRWHMRNP